MSPRGSTTQRAATVAVQPAATGGADVPVKLALRYRRAGGQRRAVLVAVDETDVWFVYDVPAEPKRRARTGLLVERLAGHEDRLDQALALAADYQAAQSAFHAGEREHCTCPDPLPRVRRTPLVVIARDAVRARRFALDQPKPTAVEAA
ncbi:MAG: hypothetical protein ACRDK7_04760 [Solirubrobacteraceae bacterium]